MGHGEGDDGAGIAPGPRLGGGLGVAEADAQIHERHWPDPPKSVHP